MPLCFPFSSFFFASLYSPLIPFPLVLRSFVKTDFSKRPESLRVVNRMQSKTSSLIARLFSRCNELSANAAGFQARVGTNRFRSVFSRAASLALLITYSREIIRRPLFTSGTTEEFRVVSRYKPVKRVCRADCLELPRSSCTVERSNRGQRHETAISKGAT